MAAKPQRMIFYWRDAFTSDSGLESTTRHVLWALSKFFDNDCKEAWPAIATLASMTGYSPKTVGDHLTLAAEAGWIIRWKPRKKTKGWAQYHYKAAIPPKYVAPVTITGAYVPAWESDEVGAESHAVGAEPDGHLHRYAVHTNSAVDSKNNSTMISANLLEKEMPKNSGPNYAEFQAMMASMVRKQNLVSRLNAGSADDSEPSQHRRDLSYLHDTVYNSAGPRRASGGDLCHRMPSERGTRCYTPFVGHLSTDFWSRSYAWRLKK